MTKKLYVMGVGPGSKKYLTDYSKEIIKKSNFVIGYKFTLNTIEHILDRSFNHVFEITMKTQEQVYLNVFNNLMKDRDTMYCPIYRGCKFF